MDGLQTDVEAIDRILDSLGHQGELEERTAQSERIVLFYRSELRAFLVKELRASDAPLSTRDFALRICGAEGRSPPDKRLLSDVVNRASKALRMMRVGNLVAVSHYEQGTCFWRVGKLGADAGGAGVASITQTMRGAGVTRPHRSRISSMLIWFQYPKLAT